MAEYLELAARGWDLTDWVDQYYPEDIPEDWRLSYYANEHRFVLVPQQVWSMDVDVTEWLEDLTEPFGFHLQIESADADMGRFARQAQGLGSHYQGALMTVGTCTEAAWDRLTSVARLAGPVSSLAGMGGTSRCWQPGEHSSDSGLGLLQLEGPQEPVELRRYIEAFMSASAPGQGLLYVQAPRATFELLKTLRDLMGL